MRNVRPTKITYSNCCVNCLQSKASLRLYAYADLDGECVTSDASMATTVKNIFLKEGASQHD